MASGKLKIGIVETSEATRTARELLLKKEFELISFGSGDDAAAAMNDNPVLDVLIYDAEDATAKKKVLLAALYTDPPNQESLIRTEHLPELLALFRDYPTLEELEKRYMKVVLAKTDGRKEKASRILGINRRTLYRKEREYGWVTDVEDTSIPIESDSN